MVVFLTALASLLLLVSVTNRGPAESQDRALLVSTGSGAPQLPIFAGTTVMVQLSILKLPNNVDKFVPYIAILIPEVGFSAPSIGQILFNHQI